MTRGTKNASGIRRRDERSWPLGCGEEPPLASHLVTPRLLYARHGIYVGDGRVTSLHRPRVRTAPQTGGRSMVSSVWLPSGHGAQVRRDARCFARCEVVERARSRFRAEDRYRVLTNNCEHFCAWARRDERRSMQDRAPSCHAICSVAREVRVLPDRDRPRRTAGAWTVTTSCTWRPRSPTPRRASWRFKDKSRRIGDVKTFDGFIVDVPAGVDVGALYDRRGVVRGLQPVHQRRQVTSKAGVAKVWSSNRHGRESTAMYRIWSTRTSSLVPWS